MTRSISASMLFVLCGCTQPFSGTVVGNPGQNALRVASGRDVETESAVVGVDVVRWSDCDGEGVDITWDFDVNLLTNRGLQAPRGTWCEVQVVFDTPMLLEGVLDLDGEPHPVSLEVELDSAVVRSATGFEITRVPIVLELGFPDWFGIADLTERDGGFGLHPGDEAHDRLRAVVAVASGMYEDPDADGELGTEEREEGALASGARRPGDRR
jgi:hypothetical protein